MTQHHLRRSRLAAALTVPIAGALILSGCSSSNNDGGSADGSVAFSLTYATSNTLQNPYETLAKEYMKTHKGVTVTLNPQPNDKYGETLRTQLQAGNGSDVIQASPGSGQPQSVLQLAEAGFLEPLGDKATKLILPGSESLLQLDGKTYAQPLDFTVNSFVVNQTTADAAGLSSFPKTTDDFLAACKDVAKGGKSLIVLAGAAGPNAGLTAQAISATRVYAQDPDWNKKRADGDVTFADSKGWQETLQTIIDLKDAGCFQAGAEGAGFDAITNGLAQGTSIGSFIPGGSAVEIGRAAADQKWGIDAFPPADGGKPFVLASSNYSLAVNAKSKQKDAALAFVEWMGEPEQAAKYADLSGQLPVTGIEDYDFSSSIYAPVEDILKEGNYTALPNSTWPNAAVYDALQTGVQGLLTGQQTVEQVLKAMDAGWGN